MGMTNRSSRSLEEETWLIYESIGRDEPEITDRKLKAIDLLVKIRSAGHKVQADEDGSGHKMPSATRKVLDMLNATK